MPEDKKVENLIINKLTKEQYKNIEVKANDELYDIIDEEHYTSEELNALLELKQNKLTAGENISIEEDIISATYTAGEGIDITNGIISNTQTSAEWGNIKGDINTQEDLQQSLNTKVDKENGKSLISDTEIERLANVDNYDDTAVKDDISSINTDIVSINNDLDSLENQLNLKQNLLIAGENITITPEGDSTRIDATIPTVSTDDMTIIKDDNDIITAIGTKSKNNIISYDWIGTIEEYNNDLASGLITNTTKCFITDDETELTHLIEVNTPTKLSELANDTNFVDKTALDNVKNNLQQQIDAGFDDSNFVHKTGNETIEGFKKFKEKIVVENDYNNGRIAHKNISSSLEDGYIEFGENTLIYGKQNIQGEAYDEKKNIFHEGNLVAGDNIIITKSNGIYKINGQEGGGSSGTTVYVDDATIVKDDQEVITTVGVKSKSDIILYDWVGTSEEYKKAVEDGIIESNWICYITDDDKEYESPVVRISDTALLDIIISNHLLEGKEKIGKELQGSLIYKYAYPDAYDKLLNNKNKNSSTLVTESISGISVTYTQCSNSWKILDIANKSVYDELFNTTGSANFFVLDEVNELFYLPKTNNIYQPTTDLNKGNTYVEAGLPNITASGLHLADGGGLETYGTGAFITKRLGAGAVGSGDSGNDMYISFDASLSNPIYGNSNTVQPQTNNVFVYYKVGDIVSVDASINVDEILEHRATTSLDNLTTEGEKHFLNKSQITNCLLEVPQRIKLELKDGVLTLKAGSEVIVPNGFEADGTTPKFDYVTVESDVTVGTTTQETEMLFYRDSQNLDWKPISRCSSGVSDPQTTNTAYYDIQANKLYCYTSSGTKTQNSLPLCVFKGDGSGVASINQIFNGFGYIGSTVWVDKDVKGLIPNGRNDDGTLKNIEFTTQGVSTRTNPTKTSGTFVITLNEIHNLEIGNAYYGYDIEKNINYNTASGIPFLYVNAGEYTQDSTGKITAFNPKQSFRAIDYSNKREISGWSMPSNKYIDLTLGASGTTYTAPANGWFMLATAYNGAHYITLDNKTSIVGFVTQQSSGTIKHSIPAKKGDIIYVEYNALTSFQFRFIYAEGEI